MDIVLSLVANDSCLQTSTVKFLFRHNEDSSTIYFLKFNIEPERNQLFISSRPTCGILIVPVSIISRLSFDISHKKQIVYNTKVSNLETSHDYVSTLIPQSTSINRAFSSIWTNCCHDISPSGVNSIYISLPITFWDKAPKLINSCAWSCISHSWNTWKSFYTGGYIILIANICRITSLNLSPSFFNDRSPVNIICNICSRKE